MSRRSLVFTTAFLFTLLDGGAASAEDKVVKYLGDRITLYDTAGQPQQQVAAKDLPRDADVLERRSNGAVGIRWKGGIVYLHPLQVVVSPGPCASSTTAPASRDSSKAYAASTGGLGSTTGKC